MSSPHPPRFRSLAWSVRRQVPRVVAINLAAALAIWWIDWTVLRWFAGAMAIATAVAVAIISIDFWTSPLPWRSIEQRGLKRNRDLMSRSVRYHLLVETISERTIPLGCSAFVVVLITGFMTTASGWLGIATLALIGSWAAALEEKEQWPLVEADEPSDSA